MWGVALGSYHKASNWLAQEHYGRGTFPLLEKDCFGTLHLNRRLNHLGITLSVS